MIKINTFYSLLLGLLMLPMMSVPSLAEDAASIPNEAIAATQDLISIPGNVNFTVSANKELWQNSGIRIKSGQQVQLKASGKWQFGAFCNATGPDGHGAVSLLCNDAFDKRIATNLNVTALIAKVGENGQPFQINDQYEFTAKQDGLLYFAGNDIPGFYYDNTGTLNVSIALLNSTPVQEQVITNTSQRETAAGKVITPTYANSSKRWAVVIGVSQYKDSQIPSLRYGAADAISFYEWLIAKDGGRYAPSQVMLLTDKNATNERIRDALFNWLRQAIAEDIVTIYFAGHGSPDSPNTPDNLYLLPYDAQYDRITTTAFPMWDIETALKRFIKAKRVVVIADACHSGGVGQQFDIAQRSISDPKQNSISRGIQNLSTISRGIAVISASDDNQFSAEGEQFGGGHGVFTWYLLKGLQGKADYNDDKQVTLGELIPYLSENVRRETQSAQSPTIAGKFDPSMKIAH